jgi:hypothetical protein
MKIYRKRILSYFFIMILEDDIPEDLSKSFSNNLFLIPEREVKV